MLFLSEAHGTQMLPSDETNTLYVSLLPTQLCSMQIFQHVMDANLHSIIPEDQLEIYPQSDYHTTVVYSREGGSALYQYSLAVNNGSTITHVIEAEPEAFAMLGDCLVLILKSESLQALFKEYVDRGATFDYPEYTPHISIAKFTDACVNPTKYVCELFAALNCEDFEFEKIRYRAMTTEPLKVG